MEVVHTPRDRIVPVRILPTGAVVEGAILALRQTPGLNVWLGREAALAEMNDPDDETPTWRVADRLMTWRLNRCETMRPFLSASRKPLSVTTVLVSGFADPDDLPALVEKRVQRMNPGNSEGWMWRRLLGC